ncbi:hypothetical protein GGTG_00890 [Gaeumannomyces tritici R3-111a-1]|uniref:Restriction of telomere capping protein 5 n=1 Tax=Gaeumannomyces tritici (strain R3-111a-1) TaxID=644352 RepID=J3NI05_GAET3|nr:hypothetical protein GGTG_00890 [Gaeumannomyces tritici R3-111a-1]EJT80898.1 hypothetical protein GGTG_00890 [Gaeumannomyces tritici R3-111a-1]
MGQDQSTEVRPPSREQVARHLAAKFAEKCFSPLELYSLKDNFGSLADREQDVHYLKEATVVSFLEIPGVLGASPVLFHAISYIGAFPFLQDAPAVLGLNQMIVVITIMTDRFHRVLAKGSADRTKLLFKSLAVYDRRLSEVVAPEMPFSPNKGSAASVAVESPVATTAARGFAVDEVGEDDEFDQDADIIAAEDDDLVMAAFESLDLVDVFRHGNTPAIRGAMIPAENLEKLLMLLLLVAPLDPQEHLSQYADRVAGEKLEGLRAVAKCVLSSFIDTKQTPGVRFGTFKRIIPVCFPHMFDGLNGLFTHFLFSKNMDFSKQRTTEGEDPQSPVKMVEQPQMAAPLLLDQDKASILDANFISQLSFFIPGSTLFRRMRLLYSGEEDGFSMGSFESKVFNWHAPTVLLVRGRRLGHRPEGTQEHTFADSIPPRRFPDGSGGGEDEELTFGAYVGQPWRHTHRECFGDEHSVLFQLEPVHDVFRASVLNKDYAAFVKASPSASHPGIAFGCPPPTTNSKASSSSSTPIALGSVSLFLDSSFEFGVFTHDHARRGGAFATSVVRRRNLQDRFAIDSLEVWGCGGDEEAKIQAERWAWEAREAEARRRINLGTGDRDADRALLEMAGLVGQNRSGGSMA